MPFKVQQERYQYEMKKVSSENFSFTLDNILLLWHFILGEISMQKVKVHRYVSGKKPDYAQDARSDTDSDSDDFLDRRNHIVSEPSPEPVKSDDELNDPRLRRLKIAEVETEVRPERRRHIVEPELLESSEDEQAEEVHLSGVFELHKSVQVPY